MQGNNWAVMQKSTRCQWSSPVLPPQQVHRMAGSHETGKQRPEQAMDWCPAPLLGLRRVCDQGRQLHWIASQHSKSAPAQRCEESAALAGIDQV